MYVRSSDQALLSRFAYRRHSAEAVAATVAVIVIAATTPIAVFMTGLPPFRFSAPAHRAQYAIWGFSNGYAMAGPSQNCRVRPHNGFISGSRLPFPSPELP